jgi:hypothetical protein
MHPRYSARYSPGVPCCLQGLLTLDSNGRSVLPADAKLDLSRAYCLALAAAPLIEGSERATRWVGWVVAGAVGWGVVAGWGGWGTPI